MGGKLKLAQARVERAEASLDREREAMVSDASSLAAQLTTVSGSVDVERLIIARVEDTMMREPTAVPQSENTKLV